MSIPETCIIRLGLTVTGSEMTEPIPCQSEVTLSKTRHIKDAPGWGWAEVAVGLL